MTRVAIFPCAFLLAFLVFDVEFTFAVRPLIPSPVTKWHRNLSPLRESEHFQDINDGMKQSPYPTRIFEQCLDHFNATSGCDTKWNQVHTNDLESILLQKFKTQG
jgi:hypothetical protein